MGDEGRREGRRKPVDESRHPGIVISAGKELVRVIPEPRITAFIWGGKVRPTPTLPFGRWKGAA